MLKNIYFFITLLFTGILLVGCNKININEPSGHTSLIEKTGLKKVLATKKSAFSRTYKIFAKNVNINGFDINLDSAEFKIQNISKGELVSLKLNNQKSFNLLIKKIDKEIWDLDKNELLTKSLSLDSSINWTNTKNAIVLILYYNLDFVNKIQEQQNWAGKDLYECKRAIVALNTTRSSAIENLTSTVTAFIKQHPDCSTKYGIDSGCLWEDYLCIASQEIICNGSGCSESFGAL